MGLDYGPAGSIRRRTSAGDDMNWIFAKLRAFPTTEARITISLSAFIATTTVMLVRYVREGEASIPGGWEWLMFLAITFGMDVAQYLGKKSIENGSGTRGSATKS